MNRGKGVEFLAGVAIHRPQIRGTKRRLWEAPRAVVSRLMFGYVFGSFFCRSNEQEAEEEASRCAVSKVLFHLGERFNCRAKGEQVDGPVLDGEQEKKAAWDACATWKAHGTRLSEGSNNRSSEQPVRSGRSNNCVGTLPSIKPTAFNTQWLLLLLTRMVVGTERTRFVQRGARAASQRSSRSSHQALPRRKLWEPRQNGVRHSSHWRSRDGQITVREHGHSPFD